MPDNLFEEFDKDASAVPTPEKLSQIAVLAERQRLWRDRVETLDKELSDAKQSLRQIQEVELPEIMLSCGVREFKLVNGLKIVIKKFYQGKITPENRAEAFSWLKEQGHDDIIKNTVYMQFGKGEDQQAEVAIKMLQSFGYTPANEKSIHAMTLKAFIKEMVETGADLPLETFGVYIGNKAEIK